MIGVTVVWLTIVPTLPSVESLRDVRLQVPLRIYSADDQLMAEIGEQRRAPLQIKEVPEQLRLAFLAAEDDRFYSHPGIDWRGTLRGAWLYGRSMGRGRVPGGSTITQQVARRFFLSTDYSITRKLREILLAIKIERQMSKDEIFELYLNKEFLGHRAYGVGAAAQVYYGRSVNDLTLAESAMIAALPKAPSRDNPISGARQAMIRRNWILDRMLRLGYISEAEHAAARSEPNSARYHGPIIALNAPWMSEMVRRDVIDRLGADEAYSGGYHAHTSIDSRLQRAADQAVRAGLQDYDRRHGWRGAERTLAADLLEDVELLQSELDQIRPVADLLPAVVLEADEEQAELIIRGGERIRFEIDDVRWARPFISTDAIGARPSAVSEVLQAGDLVRVLSDGEEGWRLAQIPQAEAALVSMDAETGAVVALVGGLDFGRNQFNRVTQSRRQPGSAFKPFIYAAALDRGFTTASVVNDAPVEFDDPSMERVWRPTNFNRRFHGPTRLREAMVHSRNLVSVRLLMDVGLDYARDYITDFGFERAELPNGPSMALGSASITPLSLTAAYAVFANGGYAVPPRYLISVRDSEGNIAFEPEWQPVCRDCPEVPRPQPLLSEVETELFTAPALRRLALDADAGADDEPAPEEMIYGPPRPSHAPRVIAPQTAWLIDSMLGDVVTSGTGRRAMALNRGDLAGKTGTTNDLRDTWFAGYGGGLVTTVWLGMDDNQSLGRDEQGGRTALPLWVDFMAVALEGRPEYRRPTPVGLAQALINPETGLRARPGTQGAIREWFHADNLPAVEESADNGARSDPYDIF